MCISEGVSWTTLAVGSVLNILILIYLAQIPDPKVIIPIILILAWQYALLMQIPDALAWRHPTAQYPGKLAFILNVTQPLVLFILVVIGLTKLGISLVRLIPAIVVLTVYSILTIRDAVDRTDYDIQPPEHCKHLAYSWWDRRKYILYVLSIVLTVLCLAPAWGYIGLSLAIFVGSIIASAIVAGKNCDPGSLWYWSVAGSGVCTLIYYLSVRHRS
jgi:hypothetical protein